MKTPRNVSSATLKERRGVWRVQGLGPKHIFLFIFIGVVLFCFGPGCPVEVGIYTKSVGRGGAPLDSTRERANASGPEMDFRISEGAPTLHFLTF